ncbi:hypothetical protein DNG35_01200 [Mesonia sp. K7]|nr:hypothetical protein DNG35_01200 [Mesonia sp. K7]
MTFSLISNAQNLEVDKKDGFKTVKLGTNITEFEYLKELKVNNPDKIICLWSPKESDLQHLFNEKIDGFQLYFDRDSKKLESINAVIFIEKPMNDSFVIKKFYSLADKIKIALGNPSEVLDKNMGLLWGGNEVLISLVLKPQETEFKDGRVTGTSTIEFAIASLSAIKNDATSGF